MNLDISPWIAILSAIWLVMFILGRWQFNRVKQYTTDMILEEARRKKSLNQYLTVEDLYQQLQPGWEEMIKKNAWFILHSTELFPVPAWPSIVKNRLKFTPAWMGAFLRLNGVKLPARVELENEIERIVMLAPQKAPKNGKAEPSQ
jgi:hypothetical protein